MRRRVSWEEDLEWYEEKEIRFIIIEMESTHTSVL